MPGFLKRFHKTDKFVYNWKIANYKEEEAKYNNCNEFMESDHFFLEDGTEWCLRLCPKGWTRSPQRLGLGIPLGLSLQLETSGAVGEVESFGFSFVKRSGKTTNIGGLASHTFRGVAVDYGWSNYLYRDQLLQEGSEWLQPDGSLHLQCHITVQGPICGGGPCKLAKLRHSGKGSDFVIQSPEGKEFNVCPVFKIKRVYKNLIVSHTHS